MNQNLDELVKEAKQFAWFFSFKQHAKYGVLLRLHIYLSYGN